MLKKQIIKLMAASLFAAVLLTGCDALDFSAPDKTYQGPSVAKFTSTQSTFTVAEDTELRSIEVSVLRAPDSDLSIEIVPSDSEENTAELGVHYDFPNGNIVTIPAGSISGNLDIEINTPNLTCDTRLLLDVNSNRADFNTTADVRFVIFTPFEFDAFPGSYTVLYPWWTGSQDTYEINAVAGNGDNELIFEGFLLGEDFDASTTITPADNQSDFTVVVPEQVAWFSAANNGDVVIRGQGSAVYDFCSLSFTVSLEHLIPGLGTFGSNPVTLTRNQD